MEFEGERRRSTRNERDERNTCKLKNHQQNQTTKINSNDQINSNYKNQIDLTSLKSQ